MEFKNELLQLGKSVEELKPYMATEEATKNALIVPFIKTLGYNVFDPREVRPEFVCDIGIKKGEKIDFAVFGEDKTNPLIIIECKQWEKNLLLHESQLVRYFQVSKAKFGLLTNGITYRFYTDLEQPNIMDNTPFFEFNITDLKENQIEHLRKFHKKTFNFEAIIETAQELKYLGLFKETIKSEFENPSPELVKHFLNKINYSKVKTEDRLTKYTKLLKSSLDSYIAERVNNNLRRAMENETEQTTNETDKSNTGVVTTDEEIEGYKIVKAILSVKVPADKVIYKDSKSYFSVNYDSTLKPVCRLYFNGARKQIGLFDKGLLSEIDNRKIDDKYEITSLEDIYKYAMQLLHTVDLYDNDGFAKAVKSESNGEAM